MPSLPIPALAEDAILLRPWEPADVAQQLAAFRDPLLQQHSDWAPENEEAAHQALLDQESAREQGLKLDLAVVGRTSPADVWGGVSLNSVDREQARAAVVTDSAQRHADEALRVAPSDSSPPGLRHPPAGSGGTEVRSGEQRVAQRTGLTREGLLRSHMAFKGGRRDTVVFGLLSGDLR